MIAGRDQVRAHLRDTALMIRSFWRDLTYRKFEGEDVPPLPDNIAEGILITWVEAMFEQNDPDAKKP